jgi:hypothetical protein
MDAAAFVEQMSSAISRDRHVRRRHPMVFDSRGGRIVNGTLTARPGAATFPISRTDRGPAGRIWEARFLTLKSMRYSRLP